MENRQVVLAIDDDATQLAVYKGILTSKYDLRVVSSASEAMHYLNNYHAEIILLDIKMPNISGFEFLHDIRNIPSYVTVPIIIVSGNEGKEFLDEAKKSSAFAVMKKPVSPEHLLSMIQKALSGPATLQ